MSFRFAIMGAGQIAVKFCDAVTAIKDCEVEVAAVASKSWERAQQFAERMKIERFYADYERMLQEEKPDCVYIATTPDSHYDLARLCMNYRVPVLCEKAMFMNSRDAVSFFADAEKYHVFAMEAMWSRFLPANITAKEWMKAGKIGKVNCLNISTGFVCDPEKNKRILDPKLGGGAAFDLTVYNYELATWFLGNDIEKSTVFTAWAESGIDTFNHVVLEYNDKLAILLSSCVSALEECLIISGTEGKIVVPHAHYAGEAFLYDQNGVEREHFIDLETENGFVYEIKEVMECINHKKIQSLHVPHDLTISCAKLFDRIYEQKIK